MTILSHLAPDGLRAAVAGDQPVALTKVPGIGRKTAEKIIFHLKDRLAAPAVPGWVDAGSRQRRGQRC